MHINEPIVARLVAIRHSNVEGYQNGLKRLRCLGNFNHNIETLKKKQCDIVVVKRPSKPRNVSEYLPCIHCYGFYVFDELWKHQKNCVLKSTDKHDLDICKNSKNLLETGISVVRQARLLLDTMLINDQSALSHDMMTLIASMHQDSLSQLIKKDVLLTQFGEALLLKYGPRKRNDIAQRLRQLSRLLLQCRNKMSDSSITYMELLCGKNFDTCLSGTFEICKLIITEDGRREFNIPSLALRLGHLLKKMATIKRGYCLRKENEQGLKEAETFGQLLKAEWTDAVASNAHNTLKRRKDQTLQVLPLTDDLRKLREYQMTEMTKCIEDIQETPVYSTWRKLAQLTMTRMIIFNKRRGGEVSKLLLQTYQSRPDWEKSTNQEVLSSLKPLEQKLLSRVDLVQIPGKKNRKVPMLITTDCKQAIETLIANRDKVNVPSSNPYCFATRSAGHLDSWQAMSFICQEASLKQPELVTSTKLRKYNATVSQLFDLNQGELEWLSNHMGHDLNIHKDFYRLHDSTIEIAKVSRLLMAIDTGNAAQFVGKKLTDISLDDFGFDDSETARVQRRHTDGTDKQPLHESTNDGRPQNSKQGNVEERNSDTLMQDGNKLQKLKRKARKRRLSSDSEDEDMGKARSLNSIPSVSQDDIDKLTEAARVDRSHTDGTYKQPHESTNDGRPLKSKQGNAEERNSDSLMQDGDKLQKPKCKARIRRFSSNSEDEGEGKNERKEIVRKSSWSSQEIKILKTTFGEKLKQGMYPSGKQIQLAISHNTCLQIRSVFQVRAKLQHLMKITRNELTFDVIS